MAEWWKKLALILAAIGAINWGLDALNFNVVDLIFGATIAQYVYFLVGICGIYALIKAFK
jgi:uncharacterized membrane protein YuzA (DUF378 family)